VTVTNISADPLPTPMYLVVRGAQPSEVVPVGAPGAALTGEPFYPLDPFVGGADLPPGETTTAFHVELSNPARAQFTLDLGVYLEAAVPAPPAVGLETPPDGLLTNVATQAVAGTVSDPGLTTATLLLNGIAQPIAVVNSAFSVPVELDEGDNTVQVTATNAGGTGESAEHTVTLDTTAPVLEVTSPDDGATVPGATVDVSGTVDDPSATVAVDGVEVPVIGGSWSRPGVPLALAPTPVDPAAPDPAGNTSPGQIRGTRAGLLALTNGPGRVRLDAIGATAPLTVTGTLSSGS
jgi:hypothetical protein